MGTEVPTENFDWGSAGMRCAPPGNGLPVVRGDGCPRSTPGYFHGFHKHPDQDEMITVVSGKVTQFLEGESTVLGPGDSVYIDKDVVHGVVQRLRRAGPARRRARAGGDGDGGYVAVDVSAEEPWASLR